MLVKSFRQLKITDTENRQLKNIKQKYKAKTEN